MSQYIKKIEYEIGVGLFSRDGNAVELTESGKVYVQAANRILEIEHNLKADILNTTNYTSGVITVGISPYRGASIMPKILNKFKQEYPLIKIVMEERITAELIDGIKNGEFDLCVASIPTVKGEFEYRLMQEEELLLAIPSEVYSFKSEICAGKTYPIIDFTQCNGLPFITQKEGQAVRGILDDLVARCSISVNYVVECVNVRTMHAMVYNGVGCALIPEWCTYGDNYNERVRYYSILQPTVWNNAIYWRRSFHLTNPMKRLVELLEQGDNMI
jgi:DNA-binding transcriptional LysR family regulator